MDNEIIAVVVYPDRARLTRRGEIDLTEGVHSIEFTNISNYLDPDSMRANAKGTARARITGLKVKKEFYQEATPEHVRELENQVENTLDELNRIDAQIELVKDQKAKVKALGQHTKTYAKSLARKELNIEYQLALFDSLRTRAERLEMEILDLGQKRRELENRLHKLEKQLNQIQSSRPRERYKAIIELEVLQPGKLIIDMIYIVSKAGWKPLYDMRFLEENNASRLEVGFLAQVTQRTGENWGGVSLTLSTARPALNQKIPELDPEFIAPYTKPIPLRSHPEREILASMLQPAVMEEKMYRAEPSVASVEETVNAVSYKVPGKVVIPADGEPHKVTVARFFLTPEIDYVTAPKIADAAYRRAVVINNSPYTLLAGSANIFVGDEYIGATKLKIVASQGEFELYLGVDDRIRVQRELKQRGLDKAFISGKRRIHYTFEIKLENHTSREVSLLVHDQIPVSRHEDIKVKLDSSEPKPTEQSDLNLLDWRIKLAAGSKETILFSYDVEHPAEMHVSGLI